MSQLERREEERRYGPGRPATAWLTEVMQEIQVGGSVLARTVPHLMGALNAGSTHLHSIQLVQSNRGGVLAILKKYDAEGARLVAFVGGADAEEALLRSEQMFQKLSWRQDAYQK